MWVFDRVKAIQCPAAVCNLDREYECEMGSNGHKKMNVAVKNALCRAPY